MASIDTGGGDSGHKKGPGVKKAKKLSTRVDMTPMVDLGFLLITFFIFTTTMTTPTTLDLNMPKDIKDQKEQTEAKESSVLTILLGKGDQVYYYEGKLEVTEGKNNFKSTTFKGIRDVIIKPDDDATYKNTVDILDEMTINQARTYAMVKILKEEVDLIKATEATNGIK